ncbi:unnamed protein product [Echinostoma caproni]|uniref:CAP10 domain-containing protein n=1 Tax=Echinostoma caproni TaxID=27848 RepID=A0A183AMI8_9TREM|nr:unnamed protein product [Echinostoma caproni]
MSGSSTKDQFSTTNQRNTFYFQPINTAHLVQMSSSLLNGPVDNSHQQTLTSQSPLAAISPWFSAVGKYVLHRIPVYKTEVRQLTQNRPLWIVQNIFRRPNPSWMNAVQAQLSSQINKVQSTQQGINLLAESGQKVKPSVKQIKLTEKPETLVTTQAPVDSWLNTPVQGEEPADNTSRSNKMTSQDANEPMKEDRQSNQVPNARANFTAIHQDWQDSAKHMGGILFLAVQAGSGIQYRDFHNRGMRSNSNHANWFIHPKFHQWTPGVYDRVFLEFWKDQIPQVRLVFTGRTDPFFILQKPTYNPDARTPLSKYCSDLKIYLLVLDAHSPLSVCYQNTPTRIASDNQYPKFLYRTPIGSAQNGNCIVPLGEKPESDRDRNCVLHQADELRIYAVPYSLYKNSPGGSQLTPYPLLFALDSKLGASVSDIWQKPLISPPGYQPFGFDEVPNTRCECWFRSRALEQWVRPVFTTPSGQEQTDSGHIPRQGFTRIHVTFQNVYGRTIAMLVFDTRGARADCWFTASRLLQAWPWNVEHLRHYRFIQFGVPQNSSIPKQTSTHTVKQTQVDFWIGNVTQMRSDQSIHVCTSLVLVMRMATGQIDGKPHCLFGLEHTNQLISEPFMGVSYVDGMAWEMIRAHQLIISSD